MSLEVTLHAAQKYLNASCRSIKAPVTPSCKSKRARSSTTKFIVARGANVRGELMADFEGGHNERDAPWQM